MELILAGDREFVDATRATALLEPFAPSTAFHRISLRNKSYSLDAAQVLAAFLKTIPHGLAVADLADMIAGRPEDEALLVLGHVCDALSSHQFLEIDLSDNALGEKGVRACFGVLERQKNLERLYLCNNGLSAESAQVIADTLLFQGPTAPTKLKTFHFYNNMSGDGGAKALATIFPATPELEDLRFSTTRSQRAGCRVFAEALGVLKNLKRVDLSDNTFGEEGAVVLADSLAKQSHLKVLVLRDASIGDAGLIAISNALVKAGIKSLKALDVSGNDLTEESMSALAALLRTLPHLEELRIEENEIGTGGAVTLAQALHPKSSVPRIRVFQSNSNELTSTGGWHLVSALAAKPDLAELELNGNMFSDDAIAMIEALLFAHAKDGVLREMDDNMEDDEDFDEDIEWEDEDDKQQEDDEVAVEALTKAMEHVSLDVLSFDAKREVVDEVRAKDLLAPFQGRTSFHTISLRGKSYTQAGAKVMADFLGQVQGVKVADLADIIAGRPEDEALIVLTCICEALAGHVLDEIDLSDNALGEKGVRACFAVLIPQPQLKHLHFCNNGISAAASAVIANEVVLQSGVSKSLESFHFFNNMSGHDGCLAIAAMLHGVPNLKSFRYASARAGADASLQLAQSIAKHLTHLTHLDLSDCSFDDQGSVALASAIAKQPHLKVLKLRDASLGASGAKLVVQALVKGGIQLESLDLSGNELEDDGVEGLVGGANALSHQTALKVLRLDENECTSNGVEVLAKAAANSWENLEEVSLYGNEITARGAVAIAKAVASKRFLKLVNLDSNMISSQGVDDLKSVLDAAGKASCLGPLDENDEDAEDSD
ncbi:unnamed protein product [Aphanomyces euteiches]|uniref:Ran-GTPase activating protein 1 C-terminal domain-containing protein n=1 Tax=Aphanomyces euteiches TaxID=100861 RepID=A0A6G0X9X5_9STRA|nr:hypothetical protein Ae201684_007026 [Aphanomyces euteiches]KAH9086833.1 hypothetical protein Ae201684P_000251 [Aphanomyces euteiches]KAH9133412.1 hypothetical protein AeRB84_020547 [Aphanomyces euteiches]